MKHPSKCRVKFCRRPHSKKSPLCSRCKMRIWRANNPEHALLAWVKDRAVRDHREFDITLDWFRAFLLENHYDRTLHHIDRISVARGYVKDNLQVLFSSDNIAKGNRERGAQLRIL